jgi:uncharacterized protein
MTNETSEKLKCGFAAMAPERRRQIAAMGGAAVPAEKRSFATDRSLAAKAGAIGGKCIAAQFRTFAKDPNPASRAGIKGGSASRISPKGKNK